MRRSSAIALAVACTAILGWVALALADPPTGAGTVTIYSIPTGATGVTGPTGAAGATALTAGPDGHPWFIETRDSNGGYRVGTVASGKVVEYPSPPLTYRPVAMTEAGGDLWFTDTDVDLSALYSMTTAGVVTFEARLVPPAIAGLAADSTGDLWITHPQDDEIGEVVPAATPPATEIFPGDQQPLPTAPESITRGPDGTTMWFTEPGLEEVGSITASGEVTQHQLPSTVNGTLGNIVLGPDNNLWVGVSQPNYNSVPGLSGSLRLGLAAVALSPSGLLQITPTGTVTEFKLPLKSSVNPDVLAVGRDSQLWMPDLPGTDGGLTAFAPATASTPATGFITYPGIVPTADTISSIIKDPGGADSLWLTDQTANTIDNVPLTPPVTTTPPTSTTSTTTTSTSTSTAAPPALTPELLAVSGISTSGATLTGTISEPAGSPSTPVSYSFQYGTTTAYGSSTPSATATVTPAGVSVSATLSGLVPYTTYHYRLSSGDCAASSCVAVTPDQTFTTGSTLQPALNTDVGLTTTSGHVLVELHGKHHFVSLTTGELIPLGATVDALHGTVLIQSATASTPGQLASGLFSGGDFTVTQPRGGKVTVLVLASSFKACVATPVAQAATAAAKRKKKKSAKSKKVVNQVFGNAHGQFSTRGHYATAADQGTRWRTADRCDGTLIAVTVGRVTVTDRVRHRTFVLTAGHHYLTAAR
jgi:hypothetical protein